MTGPSIKHTVAGEWKMAQGATLTEFGRTELVEYFDYLDDLRESGETNMFGAGAYLQNDHGLKQHEARAILKAWMATFDGTSDSVARVEAALSAEPLSDMKVEVGK